MENQRDLKESTIFIKSLEKFLFQKFINNRIFKKRENIIRIPINMDQLWFHNPFIVLKLLKQPLVYFRLAEKTLIDFFKPYDSKKNKAIKLKINLHGPFGNKNGSPSGMKASFLGQMVSIKGLIVETGIKKIGVKRSVYFCKSSEKFFLKNWTEKKISSESFDFYQNNMEIETGLSKFFFWQEIVIQDLSQEWDVYNSPKTITVVLEEDFVEKFDIGEPIEVIGTLLPVIKKKRDKSTLFSPTISALSVYKLKKKPKIFSQKLDFIFFENFSKMCNCFDILTSFILPELPDQSIFKKGLLLFLGGNSINSNQRKGEIEFGINILLLGNCVEAIKKYLNYVSRFFFSPILKRKDIRDFFQSPLEITKKKIPRHQFLQSSFSYFNSKVFCIENLENFSSFEKNLLKEMIDSQNFNTKSESGNLHIPFGKNFIISSQLNFIFDDNSESLKKNINIPDSILTNFDIVCIFDNDLSIEEEKKQAKRVLSSYNNDFKFNKSYKKKAYSKVFNDFFANKSRPILDDNFENFQDEETNLNFLRIYIEYSKMNFRPYLSDQAETKLIEDYLKWKTNQTDFFTVSIKKLETMIRLSRIFTKLHFRKIITFSDVSLINKFLFELSNRKILNAVKKINFKLETKIKGQKIEKLSPNLTKNYNFKDQEFEEKWKIKKVKKILPNIFRKLKNNCLKFCMFKKLNLNKIKNSQIETAITDWVDKGLCIIIKNIILKI
jgi:DNA replication licensing factor MCM3